MGRLVKKQKHEIGLPPDELMFRGTQKMSKVRLRLIDYSMGTVEEKAITKISELIPYSAKPTNTWINIDGLHDSALMQQLSEGFNLETLALAGVMDPDARPKLSEYAESLCISIKMLQTDSLSGKIMVENLSLILTPTVLFSFQEQRGDFFDPVRERIRRQRKRICTSGPDYLAFALLDVVVDNYIYVLSQLGDKIETLELNLLHQADEKLLNTINSYKQDLNMVRRSIRPAKEVIFALMKLETDLISDDTDIHLKELNDNINQAIEASESYREILSDQLNIYHTKLSSKLNDVMKILTVFSVVFIPLTFIAGIYGTNFDYIPELKYKNGYFAMWGIMVLMAAGMLLYFRKKKWF